MERLQKVPAWLHFEHQADIGIRGYGRTLEEAFEQAAVAMTAVMTAPEKVVIETEVTVTCEAADRELLLTDWLNALLTEMSARRMVFGRFHVTLTGNRLEGVAYGERIDRSRHQPVVEVKGASYLELKVSRDAGGVWMAQCVVDV